MSDSNSTGWLWDIFLFLLRVFKIPFRWISGTHEIERILGKPFNSQMAYNLEEYINRSKQLSSIRPTLKSPNLNIITVMNDIIRIKQLSTSSTTSSTSTSSPTPQNIQELREYVETNLRRCLQIIKYYNQLQQSLNESIIQFDINNNNHRSLLKQLWFIMNPVKWYQSLSNPMQKIDFELPQADNKSNNVNRDRNDSKQQQQQPEASETNETNENGNVGVDMDDENVMYFGENHVTWELLGFQSERPDTDFRGMGLFALKQMVWFGNKYPNRSVEILKYCMNNGQMKVFSWAITGIAISNDVMKWFDSGKAKKFVYNNYEKFSNDINGNEEKSSGSGCGNSDNSDNLGAVNELYCSGFMEFYKLWMDENPPDIMSYSGVHDKYLEMMEKNLEIGIIEPLDSDNK